MYKRENSKDRKVSSESRQRWGWHCPTWILTTFTSWVYHLLYREKKIERGKWSAQSNKGDHLQPLFPDSQLLILLKSLACGFLNTGPVSLPLDLGSIATHLRGTKTSLKSTMFGTGEAVLFPAKGKSFLWVRVIGFGWWLVGNGFPIFVSLKASQVRTLGLNDGSSSVTDSLQLSHLGFETVAHVTGRQLFQRCFSGSPVF